MGRAPYSVARVRIVRIALIVAPRALSPPPTADALQEASLRDAVVTQPLCAPARTALVLAGRGAKGAAHIGVIEVLDSLDIHPDIVVGRASAPSSARSTRAATPVGRSIRSAPRVRSAVSSSRTAPGCRRSSAWGCARSPSGRCRAVSAHSPERDAARGRRRRVHERAHAPTLGHASDGRCEQNQPK
jgi:hypothetical protein